jgi:hypothetical protein
MISLASTVAPFQTSSSRALCDEEPEVKGAIRPVRCILSHSLWCSSCFVNAMAARRQRAEGSDGVECRGDAQVPMLAASSAILILQVQ